MAKSFWSDKSAARMVMKAVVTATGDVVPKNYDQQQLRHGDMGITVRLDRNGMTHPDSPQSETALETARHMCAALLTSLGEQPDECAFTPGMVVRCVSEDMNDVIGVVLREDEHGLRIRTVSVETGVPFLTYKPFSSWTPEEIPGRKELEGSVVELVLKGVIYIHQGHEDAAEKALSHVTSESLLKELLEAGKLPAFEVHRITDVEFLLKILHGKKYEQWHEAVFAHLQTLCALDEALLIEIALCALCFSSVSVRKSAIAEIKNEHALVEIAKHVTCNQEIRFEAACRITDTDLLKDVILNGDWREGQYDTLLPKLPQDVLVAFVEACNEVAWRAAKHIKDPGTAQKLLEQFTGNEKFKARLIGYMSSYQTVLMNTLYITAAMDGMNGFVQTIIPAIMDLILNHKEKWRCEWSGFVEQLIECVSSQTELERYAQLNPDDYRDRTFFEVKGVVITAIGKLDSQEVLFRVLDSDLESELRLTVLQRLWSIHRDELLRRAATWDAKDERLSDLISYDVYFLGAKEAIEAARKAAAESSAKPKRSRKPRTAKVTQP